jgi:hypothetical protein
MDNEKLCLFSLKQINKPGYDEYYAKVIIAENHGQARKLANIRTGDEGQIWEDITLVSCTEIPMDYPGIVLEAFKNG